MTRSDIPEWQHKFVAEKPYLGKGYGGSCMIQVEAGLRYLNGNSSPYFSVCGTIYRPEARGIDAGGQLHDEILKYWPELAPVMALHLSDESGVPMHAVQNAWYWLAGYYGGAGGRFHGSNDGRFTPEMCLTIFADYVRLSIEDARAVAVAASAGAPYDEAKRYIMLWVEAQKERWAKEAREAIELLDRLIAKQKGGK